LGLEALPEAGGAGVRVSCQCISATRHNNALRILQYATIR
jgi:hypothetical protein